MKKLFYFLPLLLAGCTSQSQLFINANGNIQRCGSYGYGVGGIILANKIMRDCEKDMKLAGYIEIEKAGVIGVVLGDSVNIIKVMPHSPAERSGIKPGMIVRAIDNKTVRTKNEAVNLMFGEAHTKIMISCNDSTYVMQREPYTDIFGTK